MMMKNYNESVKTNSNPNCPDIPDHPYKVLVISGSWSSKINVLLNLIKHQQPDNSNIFSYVKDQFESTCQLLINGKEKVGIKHKKI